MSQDMLGRVIKMIADLPEEMLYAQAKQADLIQAGGARTFREIQLNIRLTTGRMVFRCRVLLVLHFQILLIEVSMEAL